MRRYTLSLVIDVVLAAELVPESDPVRRKRCNPFVVAQINTVKKSTPRARHTILPSWDDQLVLPLKSKDYSQVLLITVWDKYHRNKSYLGELRLPLDELFLGPEGFTLKVGVKWYQLYSNNESHAYVTGSVLLGFELKVNNGLRKLQDVSSSRSTTPVPIIGDDILVVTELLKQAAFEEWIQSLLVLSSLLAVPNDQGFYGEGLDTASLAAPRLIFTLPLALEKLVDVDDFSTSKNKKAADGPFELGNRKVYGVLYLEVVLCLDLPRMRNVTHTSFDVDPFVVVTFGKKTYRTSWKRHNLNPIFNERLVFQVMPYEQSYAVRFDVLDRDLISNHDKIGSVLVPLGDITENATALPLEPIQQPTFSEDDHGNNNIIQEVRKRKLTRKKVITESVADTLNFITLNLPIELANPKYIDQCNPTIKLRARFETYDSLRRNFWHILLPQLSAQAPNQNYDFVDVVSVLELLGCTDSSELAQSFFITLDKVGEEITEDELVYCLDDYINLPEHNEKVMVFDKCPLCNRARLLKKEDLDIISHVAVCASKDWSIVNKLLVLLYVTPQIALRKWVPRVVKKITYGNYKIGGRLANILVQDRVTGIILEEKMSVYVRLGIRLLYNMTDKANSTKVRKMLKLLSERQGQKFDSEKLQKDIAPFIKFHGLDLSDCLLQDPYKYPTFNEFFYRKLRPGARPLESELQEIAVSCADLRFVCFPTVNEATQLWIKGKNFTLAKLFNGNFNSYQNTDFYSPEKVSLAIFRLAPQDYHRFHCPVDGVIGPIKHVAGEYYTVNPMAIRLELDVFGDNVRTIVSIDLPQFGRVVMVAVGAMMVGSIVILVKEGDTVNRGDEIGYFKFGGSTIVLLMEKDKFSFDLDLLSNSHSSIETLVRVGQSVGHSPGVPEVERQHKDFFQQLAVEKMKLIRLLTGGDMASAKDLPDWESFNLNLS